MNTATTITIELFGSFGARHVEGGTSVDRAKCTRKDTAKSPIPVLCRLLLKQGHDPQERVHVIRKALDREGFIPVFRRDRTLAAWAGTDMVESDTRSLHPVRYRAFPDSVGVKDAQDGGEVGKGSSEPKRLSTASTATLGVAA
ncbi:hypothetical protein [Shinella zoogloeoides]|uniref:hypothetical protein n=1 Tax=Shinella zoogloeoides TaxID=352475 RepID=UPI001F57C0BA|nr:hypothetical protein [Shinella zoogloeoides]